MLGFCLVVRFVFCLVAFLCSASFLGFFEASSTVVSARGDEMLL